jgi:hypothetical protein
MDGLSISLTTAVITIIVSFLVAVIIKVMVMILDKFGSKIEAQVPVAVDSVKADDSDIAAVIAIANSNL